jgi:hypothetical protein
MSYITSGVPPSGPGSGTVTSISAGTGITLTPNPITTTGTVALTVPVTVAHGGTGQITLTDHGLLVGAGTAAITQLGVASNGQLPIGSTGADPVLATLTAGANITITNGAGSITIAANSGSESVAYKGIAFADSPYTVLPADYYISADVTGGAISVLLPNAPTTGRTFVVKDKVGLAGTSNITVTTVGGVVDIDGATTFVMNTAYQAISLIFNGVSYETY